MAPLTLAAIYVSENTFVARLWTQFESVVGFDTWEKKRCRFHVTVWCSRGPLPLKFFFPGHFLVASVCLLITWALISLSLSLYTYNWSERNFPGRMFSTRLWANIEILHTVHRCSGSDIPLLCKTMVFCWDSPNGPSVLSTRWRQCQSPLTVYAPWAEILHHILTSQCLYKIFRCVSYPHTRGNPFSGRTLIETCTSQCNCVFHLNRWCFYFCGVYVLWLFAI